MGWALDGEVPGLAAAVARPREVDEVAGVLAVCNEARVPVTDRSRAQRRVRRQRAAARRCRCSTCARLTGIVDVDDASMVLDVRAGHVRRRARGRPPCAARGDARALATVDQPLDRRRLARLPLGGSVLHPLRQDRGHGRRRCRSCWPTGGSCARVARRVPRWGPTSRRCSWAARAPSASSPRRGCACIRCPPAERRAAFGFAVVRRTASTRAGVCCVAGATPAVLRLYDTTESAAELRGFRPSCAAGARRGRSRDRRRGDAGRRRGVRRTQRGSTTRSSSGGWSTATTSRRSSRSPSAASSSTPSRSRRDGRRSPPSTRACWPPSPALEHALVVSAHQSHAYGDGACLYFTFAGRPPDEAGRRRARRLLPRGVGRGHPCRARPRRRAQPPPRHRPQPQPLRPRRPRPRVRRARALKGALDPNGILNPGKLGLPDPFGEVAWP